MKVKIIGAGSIGNHHAKACRTMGWDVMVVDTSLDALERMKCEIYPQRYGKWDGAIKLWHDYPAGNNVPMGGFDIIMVDTPPDVRIPLAIEALKENPRLLHLEKPLCAPKFDCLGKFLDTMRRRNTIVTVGYNHAVSKSVENVVEIIKNKNIGEIITIDIEFREHWQGIFDAHSWLKGPKDSYLGYWERGGGAGGEHSHALHLALYFVRVAGLGGIIETKSFLDFNFIDGRYDKVAAFISRTRDGNIVRIVQDVVTNPPRKWVRIQGTKGFVEWYCNGTPKGGDIVIHEFSTGEIINTIFPKTRQDDFLWLMQYYDNLLYGRTSYEDSPLHIDFGLKVMEILHDAYRAATN